MRDAKCLIVGLDGFDPDVLANLVLFYSACGFDVASSPTPLDCDLLVVQRGAYKGEVFETRASACHIYDYTWTGTSDFHQSFPNIPSIVVIAPSEPVSGKLASPALIKSFHPVVTDLWLNKDAAIRRAYGFIHVGHRKPNPQSDAWLAQMDAVAASGECHMWGDGWHELTHAHHAAIHGPATLHQCQSIYKQAVRAFGVMYPLQRERTISGRAWQGPLNGCVVYTEAVVPEAEIPGVELCGDFLAALAHSAPSASPAEIIKNAALFWDDVTARLAADLGLRYVRPAGSMVRSVYAKEVFLRHLNSRARRVLRRA